MAFNTRIRQLLTIALAVFIVSAVLTPLAARAATYESGWQIIPEECLGDQGPNDKPCDLNSFLQLFVNIAGIGIKLLPYIAMVMIVWAGFDLIMAGGNPEKVQGGKRALNAVVIGVMIVIILAWAWSYFVVFVLTNSTNVFPGYIWEREWWGGGTTTQPQATPETGCCYLYQVGCSDMTKQDCETYSARFTPAASHSCYPEFSATCDNYKIDGCCIPNDPAHPNCYKPYTQTIPTNVGCFAWPDTTYSSTDCKALAACAGKEVKLPPQ